MTTVAKAMQRAFDAQKRLDRERLSWCSFWRLMHASIKGTGGA